ncbi:MAG: hypothetical protein PHS45_04890, partial [Bacilli bacterium]|nr:hypothetical protein [Bacilli bacterium]
LDKLASFCFKTSVMSGGVGIWLMTELLQPLTNKQLALTFVASLSGCLGFNYHYQKLKNTSKEKIARGELYNGKKEQASSLVFNNIKGPEKVLRMGLNIG